MDSHELVGKKCACGWTVHARSEQAAKDALLDHQERYHNRKASQVEVEPVGGQVTMGSTE